MSDAARIRTVWWTLHRWIGVGLAVLLVPIAVSGALLVWHDHLDAVIYPGRYAVTGAQLMQPSAYLASAGTAEIGRSRSPPRPSLTRAERNLQGLVPQQEPRGPQVPSRHLLDAPGC